ncbi:OmpW/AlkL family protein [Donghicola mangrovi]|uniref:Outer membrane beta-barrel protein n=1 Tax=Donghicola mangrovi TaxID=2729614 RepID=A0A850QFC8_9RHOB|nr:OmpW family outer membrane protein [Donghicola mangrovi]NVO25670.1 outer membrane beta-barrel protein [Donghicola mangrovi]
MVLKKNAPTETSCAQQDIPQKALSVFTVAMLASAASLPASAQDAQGWYTQLGIADVAFSESAEISAAGNRISGASASLSDNRTLGLGIGYRFSNDISLIGILGVPPKTTVKGTGPLSGVTVGDITYGPLIFAANYHVPTAGAFQPFIGAGVSYTRIFEAEGDDIAGLSVDDAFGKVLRVGFDYMLDDRNGVFFSANKIFTSTEATGRAPAFGGAPVKADIELDPLILHLGWTHRF